MKKIYFISGLGCNGKTTLAQQMSLELGIPSYGADMVYMIAKDKLGLTREQIAPLATQSSWEDETLDWGVYKTAENLVRQSYSELFSYLPPQQLILEGFGLFFNIRERDLVLDYFKDYEMRFILIEQPYERWLKWRSKRPPNEVQMQYLGEKRYHLLQRILRSQMPENTWVIKNRTDYSCSPFGSTEYQFDTFSNPKWEAFDFPKDMTGKTFLDIGCNTGWFCSLAEQRGALPTGIDISWQVLDKAQDRVPKGRFILSKFEDFRPDQKYDYVLCSSAFHYFKHRELMVKKLASITDYLVLELPVLDTEESHVRYQGGTDGEFCSVVSRGLIEKWLKKYFKSVKNIGVTHQFSGSIDNTRPIYLCTK